MAQFVQNISVFLLNLGFSTQQLWWLAGLIFLAVTSQLWTIKYLSLAIVTFLARKFRGAHFDLWPSVIEKMSDELIVLTGLQAAVLVAPVLGSFKLFLITVFLFIALAFLIDVIKSTSVNSIQLYLLSKGEVSPEAITTVLNFWRVFITIVLWLVTVVAILFFNHVDIAGLLSGLGIASIVVAFAFQNVLKDIFAFFTVYIDGSFAVGDYVTFNGYEGTIKEIRMRTTRIKALLGNELIVPNEQLTQGIIQNYGRMAKRRVSFVIRIEPNHTPAQLAAIIAAIKDIFNREQFQARNSLTCVVLESLTEYGLQIKLIYRFNYLPGDSNYLHYLENREQVNLAIIEVLQAHEAKLVQLDYEASQ